MTVRARQWLIAGLAALSLLVGLADLASGPRLNPLLPPAERAAERIALATAAVYVSLRTINAALSTAQEVEVGASALAQGNFQPFKVLEPLDDTVERVAGVVFAVAAVAALATVGLGPVSTLGALVLGAGLAGLLLVRAFPRARPLGRLSATAVHAGLALSLVLPGVFALGVVLGERLTEPSWQDANARIDRIAAQAGVFVGGDSTMEEAPPDPDADAREKGFFGGLVGSLSGATTAVGDAVEGVGRYREAARVLWTEADDLFHASLTLIGIFALRMIVFPALLLWGAVALLRRLAAPAPAR